MNGNSDSALIGVLPSLRRYAYFLTGSTHDADDLANECALRLLQSKRLIDSNRALKPYALKVLRNLYYDDLRKSAHKQHLSLDSVHSLPDPTSEFAAQADLQLKETLNAIAQLPEPSREVLVLVVIEGLSYKEASACLSIPIGTVMSRLARARKQLLDVLGEHPASLE